MGHTLLLTLQGDRESKRDREVSSQTSEGKHMVLGDAEARSCLIELSGRSLEANGLGET